MKFITFSEKQITQSTDYTSIVQPHLMISIRNPKKNVSLPNSHYCKETLVLEFLDEEDFTSDKICFNADMARQIIDFVNAHIHKVQLIVCHCEAGISRSIAVASALSKIINCKDDILYTSGIPNMLVYLTILNEYFTERDPQSKWSSIFFLRQRAMKDYLSPSIYRIEEYKVKQRSKN